MCEQTEVDYLDGDVVWVKLGSCWWPGEVVGPDKLPPDVLPSFRKPPIAVVKFFQESTYEYVKNINSIYKYNCSRKNEFINKGLYMYRTKQHMEKFPEDIIRAETKVGGDIEILTRDEFQEVKKESYAGLFGDSVKKTPVSGKRGKGVRGRPGESQKMSTPIRRSYKEKSDYKVHILLQGSKDIQTIEDASTPSTSRAGSETAEEKSEDSPQKPEQSQPASTFSTPTVSSAGIYSCHACSFSTSRLNVLILHNKSHSSTFTSYTPSPVRKKPVVKSSPKTTPKTSKIPKTPRPRKEKAEKAPKKSQAKKRVAEDITQKEEVKKTKTDQEIKSSLLADWDDGEEESNDESSALVSGSPELAVGAESPEVLTPTELPSAQMPNEFLSPEKKTDDISPTEKPESSSDSKYEFCEDEDWPVEADGGRKIPRVKNPSKRKEDAKSLSLEDDDVAKEVAELLSKTALPELPSVPEPLKVEENFPEPSVVKSPDKKSDSSTEASKSQVTSTENRHTKAIFKTKTFFRSRHSRSQDAIGKYVAEQLNAAERMDLSEDINGSEAVSSPEARESPPVEHVKVARLAPKMQLKKIKAEAAQLRQKGNNLDFSIEDDIDMTPKTTTDDDITKATGLDKKEEKEKLKSSSKLLDVLYPTQEIKPINKETPEKLHLREENKQEEKVKDDTTVNDIYLETTIPIQKERECVKSNIINHTFSQEETIEVEESYKQKTLHSKEILTPEKSGAKSMDQLESEEIKVPKILMTVLVNTDATTSNKILQDEDEDTNESEVTTSVKISPEKSSIVEDSAIMAKSFQTKLEQPIEITSPVKHQHHESTTQKSYEQYMNESTASAVDALLSVSREADRVPRIVSNDLPEDLFEDDNKDGSTEGYDIHKGNGVPEDNIGETEPFVEKTIDMNGLVNVDTVKNDVTNMIDAATVNSDADLVNSDASVLNNDTAIVNSDVATVKSDTSIDKIEVVTFNNVVATVNSDVATVNSDVSTCKSDDTVKSDVDVVNDDVYIAKSDNDTHISAQDNPETISNVEETINNTEPVTGCTISESDLQIAETLINLPSSTIQNNSCEQQDNIECMDAESEQLIEEIIPMEETAMEVDKVFETKVIKEMKEPESLLISNNIRFETEQEKSENLNAAQSLVQMSETIDHQINVVENKTINDNDTSIGKTFKAKKDIGVDISVEQKLALLSGENNSEPSNSKGSKFETTSSKLLKILEEPPAVKPPPPKQFPMKHIITPGKEKILNFDVAKSSMKLKSQTPKQKIIIRRSASNKNFGNNLTDVVASPDKIILSRNISAQDGASVQTFTIQAPLETNLQSDAKQILLQPKIRKLTKPPTKLQKIKPQNSLVTQLTEPKTLNEIPTTEDAMFDINSMPVVLSDDILTPENIEKMPIVMSDGNIISNTINPPKLIKTKPAKIENEKVAIPQCTLPSKTEVKTLLMTTASEGSTQNKVTTPNILSKSAKLRGAKPMLVIDKATGKQKIIMTKAEQPVKEIKQAPTIIQPVAQNVGTKTEKFIILPSASSPRAGRTQKIVIDPQTGKAHVLVTKGQEVPDNKPVSAKLIPSTSDTSTPGNTVMIITNAQGTQSRIVLTPEHEKILFPNKQQPNATQLKTITHRIVTNNTVAQKTVVSSSPPVKTQTRIVPKQQKGAIITSKGQLIVGGRVATTAQNIAPMPEIRPVMKQDMRPTPKRILASEPKKLVQAIQKTSSEPLIFLQQKSGTVMQLTAAQFEHLQRTGQIIQKLPAPVQENKLVVQKAITITPKETAPPPHKQRIRKTVMESPTPPKKFKQERIIAPTPTHTAPMPPLTSLSNTISTPSTPQVSISNIIPTVSNTVSISTTPAYPDLENFEELLPSTAIVRQPEPAPVPLPPEPAVPQPEPVVEPPPAQLSDGQLLAVPGENFGGPSGSFYLCVEDNGTLTPIDNRPLVLENNQLVPMSVEMMSVFAPQPERRDILEAALANSDVFHADPPREEAPDFRDLNATVSVHCRVSETSTTLNQPIMTPLEMPTSRIAEPAVTSTLEDGLAVIGVTPHTVPTSLELPITVTDPRIAPRAVDPLSGSTYGRTLLPSPSTEMTFATNEEVEPPTAGPISMPLLTDDESVGKSMPILTDDVGERGVSSVESAPGSASPASAAEDGAGWSRRLLTPSSDTSDASAEIPLQPHIQLSVEELARHS